MDGHSEPSHGDHSPVSPTSIAGMISRVLAGTLGELGYKRAEVIVNQWPEILGGKIGQVIKKIQGKQARGEKITPEDDQELAKALEESPKEAATLLGLLTADLVRDTVDAKSERKAVLDAFKTIFGIVCTYMRTATTSVALSGFLHDPNCISYWHLTGKNPEFSNTNDTYLFPNGLVVYIRYEQPTAERLADLNKQIRRDEHRHLPQSLYGFENDGDVAKVEAVHETKVMTKQLHPDRATLPPPTKGPFGEKKGQDFSKPIDFETEIPSGAPGLATLVESLYAAREAQEGYRKQVAENVEKAQKSLPSGQSKAQGHS
jgi:hypothetical protein